MDRTLPFNNTFLAALAKIIKEWGRKGELKALPLSDTISLIQPGATVFLVTPDGNHKAKTVKSIKKHNKYYLIAFHGISDIPAASAYRGAVIAVKKDSLPPLENGCYYHNQIIGLSVTNMDGDFIGKVKRIFETGSNDVFVVEDNGREYLIPAIKDIIKKIDLKHGKIVIQEMDGLLEQSQS